MSGAKTPGRWPGPTTWSTRRSTPSCCDGPTADGSRSPTAARPAPTTRFRPRSSRWDVRATDACSGTLGGYRVRVIERLAWVTTKGARGRDEDEPVAIDALRRAGVHVDVVDWDDPAVEWSAFDRVALRSAWDYPERLS